jgi:hypothetical protein
VVSGAEAVRAVAQPAPARSAAIVSAAQWWSARRVDDELDSGSADVLRSEREVCMGCPEGGRDGRPHNGVCEGAICGPVLSVHPDEWLKERIVRRTLSPCPPPFVRS